MTLTINAVTNIGNRAVLTVVSRVYERGKSLPFESTYVPADSYGNRYLYPGMVIAMNSDQTKYVPSAAAASYGAYSAHTYAVGILDTLFDFTFEEQIVAPVIRGTAVEEYCYIYGGALGTIADAVKTATGMKLMAWG